MKTKAKIAIVTGLACFGLVGCSSATNTTELEGVPMVIGEDSTTAPTGAPTTAPRSLGNVTIPSPTATTEAPSTTTPAPTATPQQSNALTNCAAVTGDQITIDGDSGCATVQTTHPQTFQSLFDRDLSTATCMWREYSLDSADYSEAYNLAWAEGQCLNATPTPTETPTTPTAPDAPAPATTPAPAPNGNQALASCNAVTGGVLEIGGESASCADLAAVGTDVFMEIFNRDIPTATCMWREFSLDAEDYSVEYNLEWAQFVCLQGQES